MHTVMMEVKTTYGEGREKQQQMLEIKAKSLTSGQLDTKNLKIKRNKKIRQSLPREKTQGHSNRATMVLRQTFKTVQFLIPHNAIISRALMTKTLGKPRSYCISLLVYQLHDIAVLLGQIQYLVLNGLSTNIYWMEK